jgi:2-polyprenyl-3-methyl-5-hydroxy-6-metoxy-1,4-benzoquinol methylase
MIARKRLPAEFEAWNEAWGAPYGYRGNQLYRQGLLPDEAQAEALLNPTDPDFGPFAFQRNSDTRVFEYAWAFSAAKPEAGMSVLDIGGGTSGLQYVLAKTGCAVTNCDAAAQTGYLSGFAVSFSTSPELHATLNTTFGTDVRLIAARIQDADLPDNSFDRVFCVSMLEHVSAEEGQDMMETIARLLRPGGLAVLTVDMFFDLKPFGVLDHNIWGINHNIAELVKYSGLTMVSGDPRELLGFPEFDFDRVVSLIPELHIANFYPTVPQTLALQKQQ